MILLSHRMLHNVFEAAKTNTVFVAFAGFGFFCELNFLKPTEQKCFVQHCGLEKKSAFIRHSKNRNFREGESYATVISHSIMHLF